MLDQDRRRRKKSVNSTRLQRLAIGLVVIFSICLLVGFFVGLDSFGPGLLPPHVVIVGAGAAGCKHAERLTRNPKVRVYLLEAGDYPDLAGEDARLTRPSDAGTLEANYYSKYFFQQAQQKPEKVANRLTRQLTSGKLFGGGSTVNGLQVAYGSDQNWARMATRLNEPRFEVDAVKARFASLEEFTGVAPAAWRGQDSSHRWKIREVGSVNGVTSFAAKMMRVYQELTGVPETGDYNSLDPASRLSTFTRWQLHMDSNFNRSSSYTAFLSPDVLARPNLHVIERAFVTRVRFDPKTKRANVVEYLRDGRYYEAKPSDAVVIAAGVFSSVILEHSGIGDRTILEDNQIPVVVDNRNVGEHMTNHDVLSIVFTKNASDVPSSDPNDIYEGGAWLPTPNPGPGTPPFQLDDATDRRVQVININLPGIVVLAMIDTQPQSRGYTHVYKGPDPLQTIRSSDGIMTDPNNIDRLTYRNFVRNYARGIHDIFQSPGPNQDTSYTLINPPLSIIMNDTLIDEWLFENVNSHAHHWTGTVRMAKTAAEGVCDSRGRVFGVKGLYVTDVSIMPFNHDGNTVAPAIFLGDYVAETVLEDLDML